MNNYNSTHVYNRINSRLQGLVTDNMVRYALHIADIVGSGKYYVELAKLNRCIHLDCEGNINGDVIVAVIKNNALCTIMLAKSWKIKTYFTDGKYVT